MEGLAVAFMCALVALIIIAIFLLFSAIKILYEYERGVIFNLGKYSSTKGPGVIYVIPIMQTLRKVDVSRLPRFRARK